jgi:RecB family exonuclease
MNELPHISASKIKTYKTCNRQYYYKYIAPPVSQESEERNVGALIGTALHKAIETYYKEKINPALTFQAMIHSIYDEWELQGYTIKGEEWLSKNVKEGKQMLKDMQFDTFHPTALELHFSLPFPNEIEPIALMTGYIDLVDEVAYVIADHKSQRKVPAQDQLDNDAQFIIYYWAFEQLYKNPPQHIYWNHLRTSTLIEVNIANNYEDKLQQLTADVQAMLQNTHYARINLGDVCKKECAFYNLCFTGN